MTISMDNLMLGMGLLRCGYDDGDERWGQEEARGGLKTWRGEGPSGS
jgi:hypothetical protein